MQYIYLTLYFFYQNLNLFSISIFLQNKTRNSAPWSSPIVFSYYLSNVWTFIPTYIFNPLQINFFTLCLIRISNTSYNYIPHFFIHSIPSF